MNTMQLSRFYSKHYKLFMIVPLVLVAIALIILYSNYIKTGEFLETDITLKGGTSIAFYTEQNLGAEYVKNTLVSLFNTDDIIVREITDTFSTKVIGYDIQIPLELDETVLNDIGSALGMELNETNSNIGIQSPIVAKSFFNDALRVFAIAFVLLTLVVLFYFRNIIPSLSITVSTIFDVIIVLAVLSIIGEKLSIATIGAFLMIIGYSTNSDILLSTYILKRRDENLNKRMKSAFKTQITMDIAAYVCFSIMFLFSSIEIIRHIALILLIGVFSDTINTWMLSAGLQRWYLKRKKGGKK